MDQARDRLARWVAEVGSQQKAADLIDVAQVQISRWCSGKRRPSLTQAVRIEAATVGWSEGPIRVSEWASAADTAPTGTDG